MKLIIITGFIIFYANILFAQSEERDYEEELKYQNKAINSFKAEIEQLRSKIKSAESRERSTSNRILTSMKKFH